MLEATRRFYGLPVTAAVVKAIDEGLTDRETDDLVVAHLSRNYEYFGAVDKTLTGFVILDSEGDNYHLLDLRGGGQVYWQDHETRALTLRFDGLDDYLRFQRERRQDGVDEDELLQALAPTEMRPVRTPSSAELLNRSQWLVRMLAQPMKLRGEVITKSAGLADTGRYLFEHYFGDSADETFEAEREKLSDDPHLGIYWLLHTCLCGDTERLEAVKAALASVTLPLVRAFVDALGDPSPALDVPCVPDFRLRRSLLTLKRAHELEGLEGARLALAALEMDATAFAYGKAAPVAECLEAGALKPAEVEAVLAKVATPDAPFVLFLKAQVAKAKGEPTSPAADALLWQVAQGALAFDEGFFVAQAAAPLASEGEALAAAAVRLSETDAHNRRVIQLKRDAQRLLGTERFAPDEALVEAQRQAGAVVKALVGLGEQTMSVEEALAELPSEPGLTRILARRVLGRCLLDTYDDQALTWAVTEALKHPEDDDLTALLGRALGAPHAPVDAIVAQLAHGIDGPAHPALELLWTFIEGQRLPEGLDGGEAFVAEMNIGRRVEQLIKPMLPYLAAPARFERVLALLKTEPEYPRRTVLENLNPILDQLTDAQAATLSRVLIELREARQGQIFHESSRLLEGLRQPSVLPVLLEVFSECDQGRYHQDTLACLYSVLRAQGSAASRAALLERLFLERRAYWRLCNVLQYQENHVQVLDALDERKDPHAAATYATTLAEFSKRPDLLLDLGERLLKWETPAEERPAFCFALLSALDAALTRKAYGVARSLWAKAEALSVAPISPYYAAERSDPWENPFAPGGAREAELKALLSGEEEQAREALLAKLATARKKGKPVKLKDEALSLLAGTQVKDRLLDTPEAVWFIDDLDKLYYYDGFGLASPPAEAVLLIKYKPYTPLLTGAAPLSERRLAWTTNAGLFKECLRFGERILLLWGTNNTCPNAYGLRFSSDEAAARFVADWERALPKGFALTDPFYLPGKGGVVRGYAMGQERENLSLVDDTLNGKRYPSQAEAIAAHEALETTYLVERGGLVSCLEWMERIKARSDLSLLSAIRRDLVEDKHLPTRAAALATVRAKLEALGWTFPSLSLEATAPAPLADIAALEAARKQPLPEDLKALWALYGSLGFRLGDRGVRLLSPAEILSRRADVRAKLAARYLPELRGADKAWADALMLHASGEPAALLLDLSDQKPYCDCSERATQLAYFDRIVVGLMTELLDPFLVALGTLPPLRLVFADQRRHEGQIFKAFTLVDPKGVKRFFALLDPEAGTVGTLTGLEAKASLTRATPEEAKKLFEKAVAAAVKKGFKED